MKLFKLSYLGLLFMALAMFTACDPEIDDKPVIGPAPTAADVTFSFEFDPDNANIVHFTNTSNGFILKWDLGNGAVAEGNTARGIYPLRGEYTVSLTAFTSSGRATSSQVITIAQTNPALLDREDFNLLTGGVDQLEGKTWVFDKDNPGHLGVGPIEGNFPEWWQAPPLDKDGLGIYDDEMTFKLLDFVYEFQNNGDVFVQAASAADFGLDPAGGDQLATIDPANQVSSWSISDEGDQKFLTFTDGNFFGFWTGVNRYEILTLSENELYVKYADAKTPGNAWYARLIPKGFTPPPPPPPAVTDVINVDFEDGGPEFTTFGGQSYQAIDNPDASGINTSAKVGETIHGNEPWAGLFFEVGSKIDLSVKKTMRLKVWSPVDGIARLKLENSANPDEFIEVDANMTGSSAWSELTFDVSGGITELYDRVVLFFDFGGPEGTPFYFDDIELIEVKDELTDLTIDFEDGGPAWEVFGGQEYQSVTNPDASGINTSATVGESIHGNEPWAGQFTNLEGRLDFSNNTAFSMKVWSPVVGTMRFKLESSADPQNVFVELDATNTKTNEWEELFWDFSGQPSDTYDRIVVFFDFGGAQGNVFYFDDITFTNLPVEFSEGVLNNGDSKIWKLAPQAGALGVGPAKGDISWWSNGADEVEGGRACWFNDEYIFGADGSYSYDSKGDIFAEAYMGVEADGCIAEGDIPADAAAWGSGMHTYSFSPADGDNPATITVTGTGAFIALPKAFNGGEYSSAPPRDESVTYEVLDYSVSGDTETMVLSVDIGGGFWTFVLVSE